MEKLSLNMKSLVEYLYQADEYAEKVFLGTLANLPRRTQYFPKVFYRDGGYDSYNGIEHLLYAVLEHGQKGVKINIDKTVNQLRKDLGDKDFFGTITLEVVSKETSKETSKENSDKSVDNDGNDGNIDGVKEGSLRDVKQVPDIDTISKASVEMKAAEFKDWLKEYLLTFETFDFKVDKTVGVKKLIKQVEEKINASK